MSKTFYILFSLILLSCGKQEVKGKWAFQNSQGYNEFWADERMALFMNEESGDLRYFDYLIEGDTILLYAFGKGNSKKYLMDFATIHSKSQKRFLTVQGETKTELIKIDSEISKIDTTKVFLKVALSEFQQRMMIDK